MRKLLVVLAIVAVAGTAFAQGWAPRSPIYIYGNDGFTWANGVVRGSGTAADPYLIEGWVIETAGYDYGIYIANTTAHFVIKNCQIRYPQEKAGIYLSAVRNGRIEGTSVYGGRVGIHLMAASDIVITGNAIGYCDYGLLIGAGSERNRIYGNSIISCGLPARDEGRNNHWHYGGRGNYWTDYRGEDRSGDGIGDTMYEVVPDRYPLMEPPVRLPTDAAPMRTLDLQRVSERGIVALAPGSLVRLTATDVGVGVDKIHYRLDEGTWRVYQEPFRLEGTAKVRMEYYAVDKLGNREPTRALTIYMDIEPPVTRIVAGDPHYLAEDGKLWATSRTEFTLKSEDASGVANIFFRINEGQWKEYVRPFTIPGPEGPHKVDYYAIDLYGNREAVQSAIIWKDDTAPVTEAVAKEEESPFEPAAPVNDGPEAEHPAAEDPEPSVPADISFRVSLTKGELKELHGFGEEWQLSFVLNGEETPFDLATLPLVVYRGEARDLALTVRAQEVDAPGNSGEAVLTLRPPWIAATYGLNLGILPPDGGAEEGMAHWWFTVRVEQEGE